MIGRARQISTPVIRLATLTDLPAVVELACTLWPDEPARAHRTHLRAVLAGKPHSTLPLVVFVAVDEVDVQTLVGFVEVGLRSHADGCDGRRAVGYIEGWLVARARRRRGVGGALIRAAEEWARRQGCREMASDTWLDHTLSRRAHEALGFQVVERSLLFRKSLRGRKKG